jgi:hypothetical protein
MIVPTIGRRVWFFPNGWYPAIRTNDPAQACDAGIAYVHSDRMINVSIADHDGKMHNLTSVPLLQEGDETPNCAYCTWMPYQQQAAKAAV